MEYRDYYAALGVKRTASAAEIKKQFRKLARQYHPDVNKGDAAAERRFKEVSEANEVLSDPEKRKLYNQMGADWQAYQRAGASGGDPFAGFRQSASGGRGAGTAPGGIRFEFHGNPEDLGGFSDFFRTFFATGMGAAGAPGAGAGGARRTGAGTRTQRVESASIEDLLGGFGGGVDLEGLSDRGSAGRPVARRSDAEAAAEISLEEAFQGTERRVDIDGRRLDVRIPRGVSTGRRIRFSGQAGLGADAGDLYLRVTVRPHPVFTRRGDDLVRELPITLEEAVLGAEVPVETLSGRVLLRIPPETQAGRSFRLAGKGMPRFRAEGSGDLYAKVRVVLPSGLDEEAKSRFKAFAEQVHQPNPRGS